MADETTGYIREIVLVVAAIITGLFGKGVWDWLTGKTKAETQHITIEGDVTLLEMTDRVAKDYIGLFREATSELKAAGTAIRNAERKFDRSVKVMTKMLALLEGHEQHDQLQKEVNEILEG